MSLTCPIPCNACWKARSPGRCRHASTRTRHQRTPLAARHSKPVRACGDGRSLPARRRNPRSTGGMGRLSTRGARVLCELAGLDRGAHGPQSSWTSPRAAFRHAPRPDCPACPPAHPLPILCPDMPLIHEPCVQPPPRLPASPPLPPSTVLRVWSLPDGMEALQGLLQGAQMRKAQRPCLFSNAVCLTVRACVTTPHFSPNHTSWPTTVNFDTAMRGRSASAN